MPPRHPPACVASHSGGKFKLNDGMLEVETKGETGYPGIRIRGTWDLSKCNRVVFELVNRDRKGELPLTVRLDNPDADTGKSKGVFVDRIKLSKGGVQAGGGQPAAVAAVFAGNHQPPVRHEAFALRDHGGRGGSGSESGCGSGHLFEDAQAGLAVGRETDCRPDRSGHGSARLDAAAAGKVLSVYRRSTASLSTKIGPAKPIRTKT